MATSQSNEPAWCSKKLVLATHAETLDRFGGTAGLRDEGRLESARSRPQNRSTGRDVSDSLAAAREAWSAGQVDTRARLQCPQAGPSSMLSFLDVKGDSHLLPPMGRCRPTPPRPQTRKWTIAGGGYTHRRGGWAHVLRGPAGLLTCSRTPRRPLGAGGPHLWWRSQC